MACRKDGKGRVLRKGEHYRKTDGRYSYIYTDPLGKKRTIYAKSLVTLRQKEDELVRDQMDGLNVLRPAPDNPDRPRPIAEQMKNAAKLAEADRGSEAPAPQRRQPDRGDR